MPSKKLQKLFAEEYPAIMDRDAIPEWFEDATLCGFCHYAKGKAGRTKWRCAKHDVPIDWADTCTDHSPVVMPSN